MRKHNLIFVFRKQRCASFNINIVFGIRFFPPITKAE